MTEFSPDTEQFEGIMNDAKGGPREAGRFVASSFAQITDLDEFKEIAGTGEMPEAVGAWLNGVELPKGAMKKIRNGFRSRLSEFQDSLERSTSWEGFSGLSEAERWVEIRKG
jgi:hypothetical protein